MSVGSMLGYSFFFLGREGRVVVAIAQGRMPGKLIVNEGGLLLLRSIVFVSSVARSCVFLEVVVET